MVKALAVAAILLLAGCSATATEGLRQPDCGVAGMTVCPTPFDSHLPDVANMLTWDQQERVIGFRNDYRAYPGDLFRHGDPYVLPPAARQLTDAAYTVRGNTYHLADYLERENVAGLLVIKDGRIAYEHYGDGNTKDTLWTSRSVGKSVVSTLVGVAFKEGLIHSLDDPVTRYEPDLVGTGWDGVNLRQLLQHTSGVAWSEDYTDPRSDFAALTRCEAGSDTYPCVSRLVKGLKRKPGIRPGESWSYTSGGAWLLGDIVEKATGMPLSKYLQERIWKPFGMASDGVWHSYEVGRHDVGAHGFNATLQDWGRFGLFVLKDGTLRNGHRILPDGWVREASTWNTAKNSVTPEHPNGSYGYQWWNNSVPANATDVSPRGGPEQAETLWALGIFGQVIAVNQRTGTVMVQWSTWRDAEPAFNTQPLEASLMFNAISEQLSR